MSEPFAVCSDKECSASILGFYAGHATELCWVSSEKSANDLRHPAPSTTILARELHIMVKVRKCRRTSQSIAAVCWLRLRRKVRATYYINHSSFSLLEHRFWPANQNLIIYVCASVPTREYKSCGGIPRDG